jgi:hypothetical protein
MNFQDDVGHFNLEIGHFNLEVGHFNLEVGDIQEKNQVGSVRTGGQPGWKVTSVESSAAQLRAASQHGDGSPTRPQSG